MCRHITRETFTSHANISLRYQEKHRVWPYDAFLTIRLMNPRTDAHKTSNVLTTRFSPN